jgi:hypothetical protein
MSNKIQQTAETKAFNMQSESSDSAYRSLQVNILVLVQIHIVLLYAHTQERSTKEMQAGAWAEPTGSTKLNK